MVIFLHFAQFWKNMRNSVISFRFLHNHCLKNRPLFGHFRKSRKSENQLRWFSVISQKCRDLAHFRVKKSVISVFLGVKNTEITNLGLPEKGPCHLLALGPPLSGPVTGTLEVLSSTRRPSVGPLPGPWAGSQVPRSLARSVGEVVGESSRRGRW